MSSLDLSIVDDSTNELWAGLVPVLSDYIAIPALSPGFDADWAANGHIDRAVDLITAWCRDRPIPGLTVTVHRLEGLTPVVICEIPATVGFEDVAPVLLYGHLDKQPEMEGWRSDLGPWKPVLEGDRLYGRGGADDGYSAFAALGAIEAVQAAGAAHPRCVVLVEASEESGSPDLPAHVEALADVIGTPQLIVCLDSGAADYEHLWITTSLRGMAAGNLTVRVVEEGLHSGGYGGVVPDGFRILRHLLERIEDSEDGRVLLPEAWIEIPPQTQAALAKAAALVGAGNVRPRCRGPRASIRSPATTRSRRCSPPPGDHSSRWSARTACRRAPSPATCCARRRPSSSRFACLRTSIRTSCSSRSSGRSPRSSLRRAGQLQWRCRRLGVGRSAHRVMARRSTAGCVPALLRCPGAGVRRGWHHPVHGDARPALPRHSVPRDRRARPTQQRPRPNEFLDLPTGRKVTAAVAAVLHAAAQPH